MATTIKVAESTRDRVNALGARTGQTAGDVVDKALDEYERAIFWHDYAVAATAVAADATIAAEEDAERELWEGTVRDGLARA